MSLHLRHCRNRRVARVEFVSQPIDRDDTIPVQEQDRERRPLLRAAELNRSALGDYLERPEDAELQHQRRTVAAR